MARAVELGKYSRFILLASMCIVIGGLYFAQEVLIPIALAVLLTFLLTPPVQWLEHIRMPRMVATLVVVLIGVGALAGVAYTVGYQLKSTVDHFDEYRGELQAKFRAFGKRGGFFKKAEKEAESLTNGSRADGTHATTRPAAGPVSSLVVGPDSPIPVRDYPAPSSAWGMIRDYATTALRPLATTFLVLILVIFMLLSREDLRDRLIRLLGSGQLNLTTQALDEASTRITRYLGALAVVNGCYALTTALGLWLIGKFLGGGKPFPNVFVWGILVGLLRFVPYVGIWIGAGIPLLLAFGIFPGYGVFIGVIIMFAVLEIVVGQFIEPMWYGSSTGMSALAVLVAAVFWTWLWGPIGLLLSTPLTVILVVMGKYVPQLKFIDILLRESPVLAPQFRLYQRLIAMDQEEAADLARDYLKEKKLLEAVYDDLLIPTLAMAEADSHHERVADEQLAFVRQSVRDLTEELAEQYRVMLGEGIAGADSPPQPERTKGQAILATVAAAASTVVTVATNVASAVTGGNKIEGQDQSVNRLPKLPKDCPISVLCLPARDEADEIVAIMLCQLLIARGYCASSPSVAALASEMVEMIETKKIDLVCVSAMPPAAVAHARYLCKRINARFSDIGTLVGLWGLKGDVAKARDRIACSSTVPVVTSLHDAQQQIEQLAHPIIMRHASSSATSPASPPASSLLAPV